MRKIQRLVLVLFCLGLLAGTCLAAQDDLSKLLEFRDEYKPPLISKPYYPYKVKPWGEEEKRHILKYFQVIRNRAPGLVKRATAYRPIPLYRATSTLAKAATACLTDNSITVFDTFTPFLVRKEFSPLAAGTLAHELTHLADSFNKIAWSKEWVDLVKPRIDRTHDLFLKKEGLTVSEAQKLKTHVDVLTQIAAQQGLPSAYASVSLGEALAEYTATFLIHKDYSPPEKIKALIQSKLLSTPFVPDPSSGYVHQGLIALEKGQPDEAIRAFDEAIKLDPDFVWAYQYRADAWKAKNELEQAISDYSQAIRASSNIGGISGAYLERGMLYSKKGESDKALADFSEAIRLDPDWVLVYAYRGDLWLKKKEYDKAIADFSEIIKIDPSHVAAYCLRAQAWVAKKDLDKAIADFSEVIKRDPTDFEAHYERGQVWRAKKEFDKAIADFSEAIKGDPTDFEAHYERGQVWWAKNEFDKAIADYSKIIELRPKNALAHFNRGLAWRAKKEYDKAIADFSEAIRLDPDYVPAYAYRGNLWFTKKDFDKALADYNQAITLDPKYAGAYNSRAWLWATCPDSRYRDGRKAVESATRACELTNWKNPYDLDTLAAAYAEAGEFEKAVELQTKALKWATVNYDKPAAQARLELYKAGKPYREKK